jgi:UDP-3-O-[3-hydroxymyristoyl] glucosamine N-acyltransferase
MASRLQATVVRDAEFLNLGFFFDDLPDKLIFVMAPGFVSAAQKVIGTKCVLCTPELASCFPNVEGLATTADPRIAFFRLQQFLVEDTSFYGAPFPTEIHSSAQIHPRAWIATSNVRVGPNTVVEANVVIGEGSLIGAGVHVRAGSILGAEGFQPARHLDEVLQMAHGGGLCVQDNVEIFAKCSDCEIRVPSNDYSGRTFPDRKRRLCVSQRAIGEALFRRPQQYHQREYHRRRRRLDRPERDHQQFAEDRGSIPNFVGRGCNPIRSSGRPRYRDDRARAPADAAPRGVDRLNGKVSNVALRPLGFSVTVFLERQHNRAAQHADRPGRHVVVRQLHRIHDPLVQQ